MSYAPTIQTDRISLNSRSVMTLCTQEEDAEATRRSRGRSQQTPSLADREPLRKQTLGQAPPLPFRQSSPEGRQAGSGR